MSPRFWLPKDERLPSRWVLAAALVGFAIAVVWGVFVHDPIPRDTVIAVICSLFVLAMKRLSNSYVARVRRGR